MNDINIYELQLRLYTYNYTDECCVRVLHDTVHIMACWHNARAQLLKQTCLHKMGLTHFYNGFNGGVIVCDYDLIITRL